MFSRNQDCQQAGRNCQRKPARNHEDTAGLERGKRLLCKCFNLFVLTLSSTHHCQCYFNSQKFSKAHSSRLLEQQNITFARDQNHDNNFPFKKLWQKETKAKKEIWCLHCWSHSWEDINFSIHSHITAAISMNSKITQQHTTWTVMQP